MILDAIREYGWTSLAFIVVETFIVWQLRRRGLLSKMSSVSQWRWALRGWSKRSLFENIRRINQIAPTFAPNVQPRSTRDGQVEVAPEQLEWLSCQDVGAEVDGYPDKVYWFFDQPSVNLGRRFLVKGGRIVEIQMAIQHHGDVYRVKSRWSGWDGIEKS